MPEYKYIIMEDSEENETIHIFDKSFNHDCMVEVISRVKNQMTGRWERMHLKAVSAGFTNLFYCYGHSESLNLSSRQKQDTEILIGVK